MGVALFTAVAAAAGKADGSGQIRVGIQQNRSKEKRSSLLYFSRVKFGVCSANKRFSLAG